MPTTSHTETYAATNTAFVNQTNARPDPKIGMGATILGWSDRYAATVIEYTGGILTVQEDYATRTDGNGMTERQTYHHAPNQRGTTHRYRFEGERWVKVALNERTQHWVIEEGYGLVLGVRGHYHDFSFGN